MTDRLEQVEPNGKAERTEHYRRCQMFQGDGCICDKIEANVKKRSEELGRNWLERIRAVGNKGYSRQQVFEEWVIQVLAAITES